MGCLASLALLAGGIGAGAFGLYLSLGDALCENDCSSSGAWPVVLLIAGLVLVLIGGFIGADKALAWWRGDDLRDQDL